MGEQERLDRANELLDVISSCGRKFFKHKGFVASLELSESKRVFFIDQYTKKRIYTHRYDARWKGFTNGGTMKRFIEALRDFIKKGELLNLHYFTDNKEDWCPHPWGYGDDLKIVHDTVLRLEMAK